MQAEVDFDFENPTKIIPLLIQAYTELQKLEDKYWVEIKSAELLKVIQSCAGIWAEAVTDENLLSPGSEVNVNAGFVVRSDVPIVLKSIRIDYQKNDSTLNTQLVKGEMISVDRMILIPENAKYSQPYWLEEGNHKDIYIVNDQNLIGQPKTDYPLYATFTTELFGTEINFRTPVFYRKNDPVEGEVYKRVEIVPEAVASFDKELYLVKNGEEKEISVTVKSIKGNLNGKLKVLTEQGWNISPSFYDFSFPEKGSGTRI